MATDFTVILFGRQHFGNERNAFDDVEPGVSGAGFVGPTKDFTFNCPNINSRETAVLMFQSREVSRAQKNVFKVNGKDVFGGIPASPNKDEWNGNILLLEPGQIPLKATGNVLHVESRNDSGGGGGNIDDFILDNIVVMYKTRPTPPVNQQ